ncbi:DUF2309 domain-containing protein [Polystyrenella longa]|uniref:DUF2309 domain-containing protein n=1 Tax=Polystyrenella longa TaxID=2528007 RepID=UPI001E38433F|nr:DUF2309 domain-containing protein [Polystyrenella longa]
MTSTTQDNHFTTESDVRPHRLADLQHQIEHAAHLLPSQGPITAFVHHNTLHAFEQRPFEEGIRKGGELWNCHAYLSEEKYREEFERDRIRTSDLEAVLREELKEEADQPLIASVMRFELRLAMLRNRLYDGDPAELNWVIAETDALRQFRSDVPNATRTHLIESTRHWIMRDRKEVFSVGNKANLLSENMGRFTQRSMEHWTDKNWESFLLNSLWNICYSGVKNVEKQLAHAPLPEIHLPRHRNLLLEATGEDTDLRVHDLLIRFCSAFLDQGFADWHLPHRERGIYKSFLQLYGKPFAPPVDWYQNLQRESSRLLEENLDPLESIEESLQLLGVREEEREEFLTQSVVALRGWFGMVWQMETEAEWMPHPAPKGSLVELLAIRLMLDRLAIEEVSREQLHFEGPLNEVRTDALKRISRLDPDQVIQKAFVVFQLAQVCGWKPEDLYQFNDSQWLILLREIDAFSSFERRRLFHQAYERRYRNDTLDALINHRRKRKESETTKEDQKASFQILCCIDDREESFRRHLEEVEPACETFGLAGFYGVAMYYRGSSDAHYKPLCPNTIKPKHYVEETPLYSLQQEDRRRAETRRRIGLLTHQTHRGSRSLLGGLLTGLMGSLAAFPLVARILFPRSTAQFRKLYGKMVETRFTELRLERAPQDSTDDGHTHGYTIEEMANIVEGGMRAIGLTSSMRYSDLIIICGHGSGSINNPHESAYNCGACSGSRGGPNARAFAKMANDNRVREILKQRDFLIPAGTLYVGCYHNTCDDSITWFDLDAIPVGHRKNFEHARDQINVARKRNAHERCRRFESAELDSSFEEALKHVETRAQDLSQVRPEYNHATNALTFVGRREWSRGLFVDRRAFLSSYDPSTDDAEGHILERSLQAVIPVCAGISLEYYFSTVDVEGYGCGSKLPHNVASLLGVMSGASSDLRPGLSAQMVEIHEPMRNLFVIESTVEVMSRIIEENAGIKQLVNGGWVQLAIFEPETGRIQHYRDHQFTDYQPESTDLPTVDSSCKWYRGWRDHLGFASISAPPSQTTVS